MDRDFWFFSLHNYSGEELFFFVWFVSIFTIFQLDYERKGLVCRSKSLVASKQTQEVRESESNSISIVINYVYMEILFLKKMYPYLLLM